MGERFKGRGEKDVRASAAPAGGEKTSVKRPRKKVAGERVSCYDKEERGAERAACGLCRGRPRSRLDLANATEPSFLPRYSGRTKNETV